MNLALAPRWLRFLLSMLVATVLVLVALAAALRFFERPQSPEQAMTEDLLQGVEVLDLEKQPRLREAIERAGLDVGKAEPRPPPPRPVLPERMVKGFVQLEFIVDEQGIVRDAKVIGAVPKGYYEAEALAAIGRKVYMPEYRDGEAVVSTRTEVIPFEVPARRR